MSLNTVWIYGIFFLFLNYIVQFSFLTKIIDADIQALLISITEANKDIDLGMLEMANLRFNQHHLKNNVVRGAAYL